LKTYYVYQISNPTTNEFYIGSRGYLGDINEDKYTGSPRVWNKPNILNKIIIKSDFKSMIEAIEYERLLIIANIKHPLNRNYSIPNPKWNRDGKVTAKNEHGKIITVCINDPLLKISLFGVTKGLVLVKDKNGNGNGNTFMTNKNNTDYLSGILQHANKGKMCGESNPNFTKIWINNKKIQKFIKSDELLKFLNTI
jgi:hypothetical protein